MEVGYKCARSEGNQKSVELQIIHNNSIFSVLTLPECNPSTSASSSSETDGSSDSDSDDSASSYIDDSTIIDTSDIDTSSELTTERDSINEGKFKWHPKQLKIQLVFAQKIGRWINSCCFQFAQQFFSDKDSDTPVGSINEGLVIGITAIVVALVLILILVLGLFLFWKKRKSRHKPEISLELEKVELAHTRSVKLTGVTLLHKIGAGNFGEVFCGEWTNTQVALKKINSQDLEALKELNMLQ